MSAQFRFDEEYLRIDPFAREYVTPIDGGGYTFSHAKFGKTRDFYRSAVLDLWTLVDRIPTRAGLPYEALAVLVVVARQFGHSLAHRSSEEIEALLSSAMALLAGAPLPDFGMRFLIAHALDGRDWAHVVEGGRRTLH